jgi:hypothetical protein
MSLASVSGNGGSNPSPSCAESANHRFLSVGAQSAGRMPKRSRISYGIKIGEVPPIPYRSLALWNGSPNRTKANEPPVRLLLSGKHNFDWLW